MEHLLAARQGSKLLGDAVSLGNLVAAR